MTTLGVDKQDEELFITFDGGDDDDSVFYLPIQGP